MGFFCYAAFIMCQFWRKNTLSQLPTVADMIYAKDFFLYDWKTVASNITCYETATCLNYVPKEIIFDLMSLKTAIKTFERVYICHICRSKSAKVYCGCHLCTHSAYDPGLGSCECQTCSMLTWSTGCMTPKWRWKLPFVDYSPYTGTLNWVCVRVLLMHVHSS